MHTEIMINLQVISEACKRLEALGVGGLLADGCPSCGYGGYTEGGSYTEGIMHMANSLAAALADGKVQPNAQESHHWAPRTKTQLSPVLPEKERGG